MLRAPGPRFVGKSLRVSDGAGKGLTAAEIGRGAGGVQSQLSRDSLSVLSTPSLSRVLAFGGVVPIVRMSSSVRLWVSGSFSIMMLLDCFGPYSTILDA